MQHIFPHSFLQLLLILADVRAWQRMEKHQAQPLPFPLLSFQLVTVSSAPNYLVELYAGHLYTSPGMVTISRSYKLFRPA